MKSTKQICAEFQGFLESQDIDATVNFFPNAVTVTCWNMNVTTIKNEFLKRYKGFESVHNDTIVNPMSTRYLKFQR